MSSLIEMPSTGGSGSGLAASDIHATAPLAWNVGTVTMSVPLPTANNAIAVKTQNVNSGTNDNGTSPSGAGNYTGQMCLTNYGRLWWWNSANWVPNWVVSGTLQVDGKCNVDGDSNHLMAVNNKAGYTYTNPVDNCLELRNYHNTHYSAVRCTDLNGNEKCAWGYGNPGSASVFAGSSYWESFAGGQDLRFVMSALNGVTWKIEATTGDLVSYTSTGGAGGQGNETHRFTRSGGSQSNMTVYTANSTLDKDSGWVLGNTSSIGAFALTLPAASAGKSIYHIKNTGANTLTITPNGSDKIDGASTFALPVQYQAITLHSDGASNWYIF